LNPSSVLRIRTGRVLIRSQIDPDKSGASQNLLAGSAGKGHARSNCCQLRSPERGIIVIGQLASSTLELLPENYRDAVNLWFHFSGYSLLAAIRKQSAMIPLAHVECSDQFGLNQTSTFCAVLFSDGTLRSLLLFRGKLNFIKPFPPGRTLADIRKDRNRQKWIYLTRDSLASAYILGLLLLTVIGFAFIGCANALNLLSPVLSRALKTVVKYGNWPAFYILNIGMPLFYLRFRICRLTWVRSVKMMRFEIILLLSLVVIDVLGVVIR